MLKRKSEGERKKGKKIWMKHQVCLFALRASIWIFEGDTRTIVWHFEFHRQTDKSWEINRKEIYFPSNPSPFLKAFLKPFKLYERNIFTRIKGELLQWASAAKEIYFLISYVNSNLYFLMQTIALVQFPLGEFFFFPFAPLISCVCVFERVEREKLSLNWVKT